jgi:hypothetical protein
MFWLFRLESAWPGVGLLTKARDIQSVSVAHACCLQQEATEEEGKAEADSGDASPTGPMLEDAESSLTFPPPPRLRTRDAADIIATCADPWLLPIHERLCVYEYIKQAARAEAQARIDSLAPRFQQQHRDYKQIQVRPCEDHHE